ncbi:MAG TPA: Mur ligase family protein [Candidatus Hydrogenedentes bacterium]|nr:Mur ligase family protein [Candidatus Hydrogenedentota bacterium]
MALKKGDSIVFSLQALSRKPRIHFSGIGGTAMVGGARLAIEAAYEVRGSDNPLYPPTSLMVDDLGVPVAVGYAAGNLDWEPDLVVVGNALSRGNPEVEVALERRLHYVSLPEWLKDAVLRPRRPVVIAGTHGKTTTTALAAHLLDRVGLDIGYLIGGQPLGLPHSARLGAEGAPFVIEGDEYDTAFFDKRAKFFHYLPEIAVVTSIEFDHGDIYADLAEIQTAFRRMLRQVPASGWLVACADNAALEVLKPGALCRVLSYGFSESADFRGEARPGEGGFQRLDVWKRGEPWGAFDVPMAGRHNLQNALAALAVGDLLGVPADRLAEALRAFRGVRRRMEVFLEAHGVTFVDDFAHHPTAVRETIRAARQRWPGRTLRVLFEPRSNTTVTNTFLGPLIEAFLDGDDVWIGPIHRGDRIPGDQRLDRAALVDGLRSRGIAAACADTAAEIVAHVRENAVEGDIVLILSNGAFGGIYDLLREAFAG